MDDSEKNIFHSSNIANQTLAGSVSDPFTLTEKEKKRQEKLSELLEKRQQKAAKKEERAKNALKDVKNLQPGEKPTHFFL